MTEVLTGSQLWSERERFVHSRSRHSDATAKDVGPPIERGVVHLEESPRLQHGGKHAFFPERDVNSSEHLCSQDVGTADGTVEPILAQFPSEVAFCHSTSHRFIEEVSLTAHELLFASDMIVPFGNEIAGEHVKRH